MRKVASVLLLASLAGCGKDYPPTPAGSLQKAMDQIRKSLPKGWKISYGGRSDFRPAFKAQPKDVVVWRAAKVAMQKRLLRPDEPSQGVLQFVLEVVDRMPEEQWARIDAKNKQIEATMARLRDECRVEQVPRDPNGNYMPRSQHEEMYLADFLARTRDIPPVQPLPTHYYGLVGIKLHDFSQRFVPVDMLVYQELMQVQMAIKGTLKQYGK